MDSKKHPDVFIIQMCLPYYRVRFFRELSQSLQGHLSIVSGPVDFGGSPITTQNTMGIKVFEVKNYFIRNRLALQYPMPKEIFSSDVTVLGFNPRILTNFWILIRRKYLKKPVILWGHGLSSRPSSLRIWKKLRIWMARRADAIVLYSDSGKDSFARLGIDEGKLFVAYNAIDVTNIRRLTSGEIRKGGKRRNVLYVGRLIPGKKVRILVEGFQKALVSLPAETKLIIIGDGPEKAGLVAMVEDYGITDRVEFAGEIQKDTELAQFFENSILTISPGYVGLSVIHSLAFGVPVLAADNEPHAPEIEVLAQGRNCEFFKSGCVDSLAEKLVTMVTQPEKLLEMGIHGVEDVTKKYSIEGMTGIFMKAFQRVSGKFD